MSDIRADWVTIRALSDVREGWQTVTIAIRTKDGDRTVNGYERQDGLLVLRGTDDGWCVLTPGRTRYPADLTPIIYSPMDLLPRVLEIVDLTWGRIETTPIPVSRLTLILAE
jgi:hypothetical protein